MAKSPDGKPAQVEKVAFTRQAADRIQRVVRSVELGGRDGEAVNQGARLQGVFLPAKVFRIGTFTGAWPINSPKVVTFKYQETTPNTVSATNLLCGLNPSGACDVSIAKEGTAWFLVQPNLTQLPGYSASGTQVLSIVSGNLRFVGTTAC